MQYTIEDSFSIEIDDAMRVSTDPDEIQDPNKIFVAIKEEENVYYKKQDRYAYDISDPYLAPENISFIHGMDMNDLKHTALTELTPKYGKIIYSMPDREMVIRLGLHLRDKAGRTYHTIIRDDDELFVGYSYSDGIDFQVLVITKEKMYLGEIWIHDIEEFEARRAAAEKILRTIQLQ